MKRRAGWVIAIAGATLGFVGFVGFAIYGTYEWFRCCFPAGLLVGLGACLIKEQP